MTRELSECFKDGNLCLGIISVKEHRDFKLLYLNSLDEK